MLTLVHDLEFLTAKKGLFQESHKRPIHHVPPTKRSISCRVFPFFWSVPEPKRAELSRLPRSKTVSTSVHQFILRQCVSWMIAALFLFRSDHAASTPLKVSNGTFPGRNLTQHDCSCRNASTMSHVIQRQEMSVPRWQSDTSWASRRRVFFSR